MTLNEKIQASKPWNYILTIQRVILFIATAVVIITLMVVVLARRLFHVNILGYGELLVAAAFWMYFIGSAYAGWEESHIKADMMSLFVKSERVKLKIGIAAKTVEVLVSIPIIYLAYEMLVFDVETKQSTIDLDIPMVFIQSAMLICFVLMTFYSVVYILRDLGKLKNN
ncbi:MAG: TRAP transporter small permease [Synergistaceae bacterium]|nr:TRAP transporter small permease [Synergistaceae bacterium]